MQTFSVSSDICFMMMSLLLSITCKDWYTHIKRLSCSQLVCQVVIIVYGQRMSCCHWCWHELSSGATCSVILSPQGNYTVFQSTYPAIFKCSGDGAIAVWTLNGNSSSGSGVTINPYDPSLGALVPSHLSIIPYSTYNNTQVACAVVTYQPTLRFLQSSSTLLIIQGTVRIYRLLTIIWYI